MESDPVSPSLSKGSPELSQGRPETAVSPTEEWTGAVDTPGVGPGPAVDPKPADDSLPRAESSPAGEVESRLEVHREALTDGITRTRRMLVASDLSTLAVAFLAGLVVAGSIDRPSERDGLLVTLLMSLPLWTLGAYSANLYHDFEQRIDRNFVDESGRIIAISMAWSWVLLMLLTFWTSDVDLIATSVFIWVLAVPLLIAGRAAVRIYASRQPWNLQPVALIGDEVGLASLRDRIDRHPEWRLDVKREIVASSLPVGDGPEDSLAHFAPTTPATDREGRSVLDEAAVRQLLESSGVVRAILVGGAGVFGGFASKTDLIQRLHRAGLGVDIVSGGPESLYSAALLQDIEGLPVVSLRPSVQRPFSLRMKRVFDVCFSFFALLLVSPIMVWSALRIRFGSEGPVIFRQTRVGLNGEEFEIFKFRTMVDGAHAMRPRLRSETVDSGNDDVLFKLEHDPRITPVGRTLRRWSVDELPQLVNVLKGEMSMVGPRPLVPEEAAEAGALSEARVSVKPGIAGPWQALGRSSIPFSDMIKLDYSYALSRSMTMDVYLLIRTLVAVLRRDGAH